VLGARLILVKDGTGIRRRGASNADGVVRFGLQPGRWTILPQPVAGLLGTAPPQALRVPLRAHRPLRRVITYDTGIR
jgi:hypothetical protein